MNELDKARLDKFERKINDLEKIANGVLSDLDVYDGKLRDVIAALDNIGPPEDSSEEWNNAMDKLRAIHKGLFA